MPQVTQSEHLDLQAPMRAGRRRFALGSAAFVLLALAALGIGAVYITGLFVP